jgi:restriction endonuclease S subunit
MEGVGMTSSNAVWKQTRLSDILTYLDERVKLEDEKEYLTITVKRRHGGLEMREKFFGRDIMTKKQFRMVPGSFIISRIQCWHQAYAMVGDIAANMIASTNYDQFAISPEVHPRFFWWLSYTPEFTEAVRSSASGVVIEKMVFDRNAWLEKTVLIPPFQEQQRIVTRIEELFTQVHEAQVLRQKAIQEVEKLYEITVADWCYSKHKLRKFGELIEDAKNGIYKPPMFWGTGVPCIRMYNINGPSLNQVNLQLLNVSDEEMNIYGCKPGDLIFNRVNSAELVGKTGLITPSFPRCVYESKNMRLRLKSSLVLPEFAALVLNSSPIRKHYKQVLKQQCGMATLNQTHVRDIPFPDIEISEQLRIMAFLDQLRAKVGEIKRLQTDTADDLNAILPSILSRIFKGEL